MLVPRGVEPLGDALCPRQHRARFVGGQPGPQPARKSVGVPPQRDRAIRPPPVAGQRRFPALRCAPQRTGEELPAIVTLDTWFRQV